MGDIFWVAKISNIFWGAWNSWYFWGVKGRCWARAYVWRKKWEYPHPPLGPRPFYQNQSKKSLRSTCTRWDFRYRSHLRKLILQASSHARGLRCGLMLNLLSYLVRASNAVSDETVCFCMLLWFFNARIHDKYQNIMSSFNRYSKQPSR